MTKRLNVLANHEMASLEPGSWLSDSSSAFLILKTVCPSLLELDEEFNLQPMLAESWTASEDSKTFRFNLRPNVKMHSGRPLTSDLVVWNFKRIMDVRTGSLLVSDYEGLIDVCVDGEYAVIFTFEHPFPAFPYHLAWRTYIIDDVAMQPCGAGAYKLDKWVRDSHMVLSRHPDYHVPGKPYYDELNITFAIGSKERIQAIESGQIDVIESVPQKEADELMARGLLESATLRSARRTSVSFNCALPPFDDVRVRQAVAYGTNRAKHVQEVYGSRGELLAGLFPEGNPWHTNLEPYPFDPVKARQLLNEAGVEPGTRVRAVCSAINRMGERLKEDLEEIGLILEFTVFDDPPWWPFIYLRPESMRPAWQLAVQGVGTRPHPDTTFRRDHYSAAAFNATGYINAVLDKLIREARSTSDHQALKSLYDEAQRILHKDLPELPLLCPDSTVGWRPGISGLRPHPLGTLNFESAKPSDAE